MKVFNLKFKIIVQNYKLIKQDKLLFEIKKSLLAKAAKDYEISEIVINDNVMNIFFRNAVTNGYKFFPIRLYSSQVELNFNFNENKIGLDILINYSRFIFILLILPVLIIVYSLYSNPQNIWEEIYSLQLLYYTYVVISFLTLIYSTKHFLRTIRKITHNILQYQAMQNSKSGNDENKVILKSKDFSKLRIDQIKLNQHLRNHKEKLTGRVDEILENDKVVVCTSYAKYTWDIADCEIVKKRGY